MQSVFPIATFLALLSTPAFAADGSAAAFTLTSPEFAAGERIADVNTGVSEDLSPTLEWRGAPAGTKSFALVCEDPDAPSGLWVHWVIYDIPPACSALPGALRKTGEVEVGRQGLNDFKAVGYGGPMPPPGKPHRYFFKLHALALDPTLPAGLTRQKLLDAVRGKILATTELMGTFSR